MAGTTSKDPIARDVADGASAAQYRRLADVALWGKNPRKNDAAAKDLANTIKALGFGSACVTWYDPERGKDIFICGNTRAKAMAILAREVSKADTSRWHPNALALAKEALIPCRARNDLTRREAALMAIADNRMGEKAEWDAPELATILSDYSLGEAQLAGWDRGDLDKLTRSLAPELRDEVEIRSDFQVVITCPAEQDQLRVIEWAQEQGLKCRALI